MADLSISKVTLCDVGNKVLDKVQEVNQSYHVMENITDVGSKPLEKAKEVNQHYHVIENVTHVVIAGMEKVQELDETLKITGKLTDVGNKALDQARKVSPTIVDSVTAGVSAGIVKAHEVDQKHHIIDNLRAGFAKASAALSSDDKSIPEGGHLLFKTCDQDDDQVKQIVQKLHFESMPLSSALGEFCIKRNSPPSGHGGHLVVFYTDFEPDDIMACAQLWQWKLEREELDGEPLIIFSVDFKSKDTNTIFVKKQLMAALMLGVTEPLAIAGEGCETGHQFSEALAAARDGHLKAIAQRIAEFQGEFIDLYIMAPGKGNLAAIYQTLQEHPNWPSSTAKWHVSMYSGAFNTRGMNEHDVAALAELQNRSSEPLIDVAKFPFFGGTNHLERTNSLATWVSAKFVTNLYQLDPILVAVLKSFNEEFNAALIAPSNSSLFKGSELDEEERRRFDAITPFFESAGVGVYARALVDDSGLYAKIAGFKKTTVASFAAGAGDSPLCDQLLFAHEWLRVHHPDFLDDTSKGQWSINREQGHTVINPASAAGLRGLSPVLSRPKDNNMLDQLRAQMEMRIIAHLESLKPV